jgi:16S rRNA (guanine527-N7)-methyltransferase
LLDNVELLEAGLDSLSIKYNNLLIDKLLIYKDLLIKWNKVFNLTAIKEEDQIIVHHFLDCLAITSSIKSNRILDVGTGAGLPGLILALMLPDAKITLVDKVGKKAAFIKQVIGELSIKNADIIHNRVENMAATDKFQEIITRAFSEMDHFIELTYPLIEEGGMWYGMKSKKSMNNEMAKINFPCEFEKINVPFLDAERYLIKVKNKNLSKVN